MTRNSKGFTLVELMIVVIIIGVLAALTVPRFVGASVRSKQTEAQGILKQIYTLEQGYFQEHGNYSDDLTAIGVELTAARRYDYSIAVTGLTFVATADCPNPGLDNDATPDTWTIDDKGLLLCTSNDILN